LDNVDLFGGVDLNTNFMDGMGLHLGAGYTGKIFYDDKSRDDSYEQGVRVSIGSIISYDDGSSGFQFIPSLVSSYYPESDIVEMGFRLLIGFSIFDD